MSSLLRVEYKETVTFEDITERFRRRYDRANTPVIKTYSINFQELEALRESNKALQDALAVLDKTQRPHASADAPIHHVITVAKKSCIQNKSLLDSLFSIIPEDKRPSTRSAQKAMEVFRVPKLLENILLALKPHELLRAQEVGRDWRDTINGSAKLIRKLGIGATDDPFFYSPLETGWRGSFPGIEYHEHWRTPHASEYSTDLNPMSNEMHIQVKVDVWTPHLGSRCRAMQVCQPPPQKITVIGEYAARGSDRRAEAEIELLSMANVGPMTMGRLLDMVDDVKSDPSHSPTDGTYLDYIRVDMTITLMNEDPIVLGRHAQMRSAVEWAEGKKRRRHRRIAKGRADFWFRF